VLRSCTAPRHLSSRSGPRPASARVDYRLLLLRIGARRAPVFFLLTDTEQVQLERAMDGLGPPAYTR
jgi:hypothetical protein